MNELYNDSQFEEFSKKRADKYFNVALEEYKLKQYEEAGKHFDMSYIENSDNYFSAFLRDLCSFRSSYLINLGENFSKLVNRFEFVFNKIINNDLNDSDKDYELYFLLSSYVSSVINVASSDLKAEQKIDEGMFVNSLKIYEKSILMKYKRTGDWYNEFFTMVFNKAMSTKLIMFFGLFELNELYPFILDNMSYFNADLVNKIKKQYADESKKSEEEEKQKAEIQRREEIAKQNQEASRKRWIKFLPLIIIGTIVMMIVAFLMLVNLMSKLG